MYCILSQVFSWLALVYNFKTVQARQNWRTPLIPAPVKQKQADLSEFKAYLVYSASSGQSGLQRLFKKEEEKEEGVGRT